MSQEMKGYKDLIVWQKGMDVVVEAYVLTNCLPDKEKFNLIYQMNRSALSIPSNIAEGWGRNSGKSFRQFLLIAHGSCLELETQIELVKRLQLLPDFNFERIDSLLLEVIKILKVLIKKSES
jgi:four helix bundle protein